MANIAGTAAGIVVAVLVFFLIVLVLSLYWQRIFGKVPTEEKYAGSVADVEKAWPKSRDSMAGSTWTDSFSRSSRTSNDPMMQKAVYKS